MDVMAGEGHLMTIIRYPICSDRLSPSSYNRSERSLPTPTCHKVHITISCPLQDCDLLPRGTAQVQDRSGSRVIRNKDSGVSDQVQNPVSVLTNQETSSAPLQGPHRSFTKEYVALCLLVLRGFQTL